MMKFTASQKLKYLIINWLIDYKSLSITDEITPKNINHIYDGIDDFSDAVSEVRNSGIETDVPSPDSRHYESQSVATQFYDGSWIGWTYWYGGGKHGCPEEIEWIENAYDLDVKEELKTVIVRTFTVK